MKSDRTIARLWRDAAAASAPERRTSCSRETTGTRSAGPRRPSASRISQTASSRGVSARATRSRCSAARRWSGRFRLCAGTRRRRRRPHLREQLRERPPTSSTIRRPSACSARTRPGREGRPARASLPRLRHVLTFADLPALEAEGAAFKAEIRRRSTTPSPRSTRTTSSPSLHVGDDGPTEGLHDPASQLLRDGRGDRPPPRLRPRERPDAALPPARAQLRPPDAPAGPYVGYTIAFLPDPLQTAEALQLSSRRPPERPSRLREDPHRVVGAIDETTGVKRRLADWSLAVGRERSRLEEAGKPRSDPWS